MPQLIIRPNGDSSKGLVAFGNGVYNNYSCVNEITLDETKGVEASNGASYDDYNMQDHTSEIGNINFVKVYGWCSCSSFGYGDACAFRCNGNQASNHTLTDTDTLYYDTWSINPSSGVAWTWSDIDSMTAGVYLLDHFVTNKSSGYTVCYCYMLYAVVDYSSPGGGLFFANG